MRPMHTIVKYEFDPKFCVSVSNMFFSFAFAVSIRKVNINLFFLQVKQHSSTIQTEMVTVANLAINVNKQTIQTEFSPVFLWVGDG